MCDKIFRERWDSLPEIAQKYAKYLKGEYTPIVGNEENIPKTPRGLDKERVFVNPEKYLLIQGFPHPKYKNLRYKGIDKRDSQDWVIGEPKQPKKISQTFQEIFYEEGLKVCSSCKDIQIVENFYINKRAKHELNIICKNCQKEYADKNKDKMMGYQKNTRKKNGFLDVIHGRLSSSLGKSLRNMNKCKNARTLDYLGCSWEKFLELRFPVRRNNPNFYEEWDYNVDHIIPKSLANQIYKRKLFSKDKLDRLIRALWHYSNLCAIDAEKNQQQKSDFIFKKRVRHMEDEELIKVADKLIETTENNRRRDAMFSVQ
jgi:hypothetical protein